MKASLIQSLIVGISLMAIGASAKAIIDVEVMKARQVTFKELLTEVRDDVKTLLKE